MPKMNLGDKAQMAKAKKGKMDLSKPKRNERAEPQTEFQAAMRNAEKQFQFNTSDNFYVCMCFLNYDDQDTFFELLGIEPARFVSGYEFEEKAKRYAPEKPKISMASNRINCNVFGDIVGAFAKDRYASLSEAALDEIRIVVDFMCELEVEENPQFVVDSGIYTTIVWRDDDDKDKACASLGINSYGSRRFLDASRIIKDWQKTIAKHSA